MFSSTNLFRRICIAIAVTAIVTGCKKDHDPMQNNYRQVNLVANKAGYGAARIDPVLTNAWGIAIGGTGAFWISANHSGSTTIYDRNGAQLLPAVAIPSGGSLHGGAPTGVVFNSTPSDFLITVKGEKSRFIYAGEDGTISAWSSGTATVTVADRSATEAVYKGLAIGTDGGANFLYVANFRNAKVDVFDNHFKYIATKPFADPSIPAGYAPFNIQNIRGLLFVAYAKQLAPDNEDDEAGAGHGFINVFTPAGKLVKRFASHGVLNSPWAMTTAPSGFGQGSDVLLVGNFGDGRINVFRADGSYKTSLMHSGSPIAIEGLWALNFPQNNIPAGNPNQLFFTAGPDEEQDGIFGYVAPQ
jgi:uncharacterized protein (TIGR03118 family)